VPVTPIQPIITTQATILSNSQSELCTVLVAPMINNRGVCLYDWRVARGVYSSTWCWRTPAIIPYLRIFLSSSRILFPVSN